jgi:hypothetical protein
MSVSDTIAGETYIGLTQKLSQTLLTLRILCLCGWLFNDFSVSPTILNVTKLYQ